MPQAISTGARIRQRRLANGLKQSDLAKAAGISASYLNLIEHDRRRIGGKLMLRLARQLGAEIATLTQGAHSTIIEGLRAAASLGATRQGLTAGVAHGPEPEIAEADQLAARHPGWAALILAQSQRIAALERAVEGLSDRLAHDPFLAESLHEVLSSVTAIRSTASILHNTPTIELEWQKRFQANIFEDSTRLAATSQALVSYVDALARTDVSFATPLERVETYMAGQGYHLVALERNPDAVPDLVLALAQGDAGPLAAVATAVLDRYASLVRRMPLAALESTIAQHGYDAVALADALGAPLHEVLQRLACLPPGGQHPPMGLVRCDAAGALSFRKPLEGFAMPQFGAACALWPLFSALQSPATPIPGRLEFPGGGRFAAFAHCATIGPGRFVTPQVRESVMLVMPEDSGPVPQAGPILRVGPACRICPRDGCPARREPSIMVEGL